METYFEWGLFKERYQLPEMPLALLDESFFIELEQGIVYLSRDAAVRLSIDTRLTSQLPVNRFTDFLSEHSQVLFLQDISRLKEEKSMRLDSHLSFKIGREQLSGQVTMVKMPEQPYIIGLINLNYELLHEYKQQLEEVVGQLKQAQNVNQLILEGSTDYIYQLDLMNNVCTFSPKAVDILPLDSPTFGNAMDKVLSFIVPEDRNIFLESFTPFLTGQSLYHMAEYRVLTRTGDIMWISCHGKGIHDSEGRPMMIAGSLMDITEQKKIEDHMHRMLYYDIRTGLKNRYCYEEDMAEFMSRPKSKGSIVCIDIRNFKLYNEIFGHNFGNKILQEFSAMLQYYIPKNLGLYRLEGDEFLIHLKEYDQEIILTRLVPLQLALSKARVVEGHNIYIDVTIGIAIYPEHGDTPDQLLKNADTVLYKLSKYSGEKLMFFMNGRDREVSKRYQLESELRNDIENHYQHFRVVFQPIVKLEPDGSYWYAAEALLRYNNSGLPDVTQQELIETLEVSDMIIPAGRWVLEQAIRECSQWKLTGAEACVHVNLSAQQLSDAGLLNYIRDTLQRYRIEPEFLICELTETSLIHNFESAITLCRELMEMGIGIALDDFGTGYSSFNYLRTFPISQIKVDKTYAQGVLEDEYNKIIISCLFDLSRNMNLELCVEGVETREVLDVLEDMGVDMIQGFYFERPLEAEVIRKEFIRHIHRDQQNDRMIKQLTGDESV